VDAVGAVAAAAASGSRREIVGWSQSVGRGARLARLDCKTNQRALVVRRHGERFLWL
jgi:hypothetical protein